MNKVCLSVVMVLIRALTVRGFSGITVATTFLFSQKRAHCHSNLKLKAASTLNPLSIKDNLPLFEELKSVDVLPVIEEDLIFLSEGFKKLESDLANPKEVSYEEVVENLEKIQHPIGYSWGVVNHLLGVKNSDELRKSHETIQPKVIETYQKLGQSQPYFQALKKLKEKTLDEAQSRVVASAIRSMESSGVGLQESDRLIFNKLQLEAAELSTKFSNNLLDSTKAFKLLVESKDDIEGLPASALGLAAQQAKANGHPDATPENGPWLLTLDMPCYLPCMQNLKNRNIREQLYRAYATRASSGELDNSPIIKRTLQIKYEMAKMLNYESHAHKSLAAKMAPSVESVIELNRMLLEKAYPAAVKELEELQSFAEKEYGFTEKLNLWDVPYFSERLREKSYEFQEEELRPYFALPNVLDGLFALAERLFDVKIVAADGTTQVWHPDVRFFNIIDKKSDERIASFFLDPYSRPEEKRGGAWMDVCVGKSRVSHCF
jgi:oligopeptidase A